MKKWVAIWFSQLLFDCSQLLLDRLKVAYQQKSAKRKKPITCPFETQIMICPFFAMFKEHYKLTLGGGGGVV